MNLSGVNVDQLNCGNVLAYPGSYQPTQRIDVRFRLLSGVFQPLKHDTQVKLFLGAAEITSRVRLLGSDELLPGEEGWLQLELDHPLIAIRGDRYILRRPSPGETLGGGSVVDPHPKKRHKRFATEALTYLDTLSRGTPSEVLFQASLALGISQLQDVIIRSNLDTLTANNAVHELVASGQIILLENGSINTISPSSLVTTKAFWEDLQRLLFQAVDEYHKNYPLRRGISREELKSRLKLSPRTYNIVLQRIITSGEIQENGILVHRASHVIQFTPLQQRAVEGLLDRFVASPFAPPTAKECQAEVGEDLYNAMIDLGLLIPIPPDVVFRKQDYEIMLSEIIGLLKSNGTITTAEMRDHFNTSRRYVLALLEYLDAQGITVRQGDIRRLK